MSGTLTAKGIAERSLRAIGAFPITESAPDGEQLREAMSWLDLIVAERAGTGRLFFFVEQDLSFDITNGTGSYDLEDELGSDLPVDRIQFPVAAWLEDEDGNKTDIEIVTRGKYIKVYDPSETGAPRYVYIDRLDSPTLKIAPVPDADDSSTYTLHLDVQTYAPNVAPAGVTGTQPSASVLHGFKVAWQRWLVLKLNIDLASGPIKKLPQASIDNWKREAKEAQLALEAFENREHDTEDPVCEPWGM